MAASLEGGSDSFLKTAIESIANPDLELREIMEKYSRRRVRINAAISSLKDTQSKKNELVSLVEDMSVLFFQMAVQAGEKTADVRMTEIINNIETNIKEIHLDISEIKSKNTEQAETVGKIVSNVEIIKNIAEKPSGYSDALKAPAVPKVQVPNCKPVIPTPKRALIITPIDPEGKTCEDTKKILLSKISPSDLGIKPDRILKNGQSNVKIECKELDESKINVEALKKAGLKAHVQGKLHPRMALFGVPSDMDEERVKKEIDDILDWANIFEEDRFSVKAKFGPRNKNYTHWVLEVSPRVRKEFLAKEKLYIGWSACAVKDHVRILRCFRCQKFGHLQNNCKGEETCGHCAGRHDTRNCNKKEEPAKCVNCVNAGIKEDSHDAISNKCQVYLRRTKDTISNTDYGQ